MAVRVDNNVCQVDMHFAILLFPADDAFDPGIQLGQVERLGQIVVGTEVETGHFIFDRVFGGDDDNTVFLPHLLQFFQ